MSDDEDDDLFAYKGGVRHTDPDTAHEAAETAPISYLERLFLQALKGHESLTTTEIANIYGMDRDSFSPRPPRLLERGLIERAGKRVCINSSGKLRAMIAFKLKRRNEDADEGTGDLNSDP